jgi:hypothetical protein
MLNHGRGGRDFYNYIGGENINCERCRESESDETFA